MFYLDELSVEGSQSLLGWGLDLNFTSQDWICLLASLGDRVLAPTPSPPPLPALGQGVGERVGLQFALHGKPWPG